MPALTVDPAHPSVLVASGSDLVGAVYGESHLNRSVLRGALFSAANPFGNLAGQVDFVVCFVVGGEESDFAGSDATVQGRPLRGIAAIATQPATLLNLTPEKIAGTIAGGVGHEVGHYWLVPGNAKIQTSQGLVPTPTAEEIRDAINDGRSVPPFPIIARQNRHWSMYIGGDNSPMDAVNHSAPTRTTNPGVAGLPASYDRVTCELPDSGLSFDLAGVGTIAPRFYYSRLERYVMGALPDSTGNERFQLMQPVWTYPIQLQAGLFVQLDTGRRWYLGFYRGPHEIRAARTDDAVVSPAVPIGDPFDPYALVGLRIVQDTQGVAFQTRVWVRRRRFIDRFRAPASAVPEDCAALMREPADGAGTWQQNAWRTIAHAPGERAVRIGLSARTLDGAAYALVRAALCIADSNGVRAVSSQQLTTHFPRPGPRRLAQGRLMMPYLTETGHQQYPERPGVHDAPKLLMNAPAGAFSFGGIVRLESCLVIPGLGGSAVGKTVVGHHRSVRFADFVVPWADDEVLRDPPPEGRYRMLFCLASQAPLSSGTRAAMLDGLDVVRRAWEIYFDLDLPDRRADTSFP
jgi:hypothetical protein